jgi:site-specific DNA-methyltransferase (adenine-specific)
MNQSVHFSSDKLDWATPDELWQRLDNIYRFDLDAAASAENARCSRYFDQRADGLTQSWADARVWCNPPYGRSIGDWTSKASAEASRAAFIVMLVPARTDTRWWHDAIGSARVEYLRGRLRFKGAPASAPFPSALLYWNC